MEVLMKEMFDEKDGGKLEEMKEKEEREGV